MVSRIRAALSAAIRNATAHCNRGREFSRKRTLTRETVIRLLIGAEGGSLDKILHTAGLNVTASAVTQRRAQIPPEVFRTVFSNFNSTCADNEFFCGYRLLAVDGTAVMLCKGFLRTPRADGEKLLEEIARHTVPIRPNRQDERNLKVKGFAGFIYRVAA